MSKKFNEKLIELLKTDSRFVDDEGELLKAAVTDGAWKIDRELVKLLLGNPEIKDKFFDEIEGHWIFNINTFIEYVSDKNFLSNSYTRFRNKIGLNIDGKFLRERGEVSLVWPYKDCVLEGGQTKEEEKRKEIFFNEILAQDEIDRLFDPKVLTNWKRHTVDGEQKVTEIKRDEDGTIRENLIIKGNNLLALHTLKKQFRGKVKLIYIDPPYNTGNDSFGYNDNFNHSTWLTFMKNRLMVVKKLLTPNGFFCIQIDDREQAYLKVLCDEIFERENFVNCIAVKMSESSGKKMAHTAKRLPKIKEYILIYKNTKFAELNPVKIDKDKWDSEYKLFLENFTKSEKEYLDRLLMTEKENRDSKHEERLDEIFSKVQLVSIDKKIDELNIKKNEQLLWLHKNAYRITRSAAGENVKRLTDEKRKKNLNKIFCVFSVRDKIPYIVKADYPEETKNPRVQLLFAEDHLKTGLCDLWYDIKTTGLENEGSNTLKNGKKPEKILQRLIKLATTENDLVLDYHLGSGTTCAVAHKMGRRYIGIEQLYYGNNDSVIRLQNVIDGDQSGISDSVNWQGGGDFIYCELMKYNEAFIDKIQAAESSEQLVEVWKNISENSFLNWYVNPEMPEEAVNDFIEICKSQNGLEKQKRRLAELLNKNQLYVNLSEIDDEDFKVSEEDKKMNRSFYGEDA
ncbi:putative type III restriction-modification system HindVIP enzyme mod [Candidatus Desulfarcum epimagneticum]|uniref:site-specific DNA-methyltransferase (adenine-specific) n=1 Tax=uncultured Desulfobacteraceae bacterium TaxID=218296 RepID=A0A484HN57_9BACT|nr:putative type III restriction-modification system HindVIP enzyme mod [uncultured Desulfobacteraceae bacterium]